jgi:mRNA interferase MazF
MMAYTKGDIVLVDFPFSDNSSAKLRPVLVISSELVHATGDLMLMMMTSKVKHDGLSVAVAPTDLSEPLPLQSYLRCHKVFVLTAELVVKKLSRLQKDRFDEAVDLLCEVVR